MKRTALYVTSILFFIVIACSVRSRDEISDRRIRQIQTLFNSHADSLNIVGLTQKNLLSIDPKTLTESDRNLYYLLLIQTKDKLYQPLPPDSLIRTVADHYSKDPHSTHYPKALYYVGRTAEEHGEFNEAIKFYGIALDECRNKLRGFSDKDRADLEGIILSNIGTCLLRTRKFKECRPYLRESIYNACLTGDSVGLLLDLKQLGISYLKNGETDSARHYLNEAHRLAVIHHPTYQYTIDLYLAESFYQDGDIGKAKEMIRPLPSKVDSIAQNTALSLAAVIYLAAGEADTAFLYARTLALSPSPLNRLNGYRLIAGDGIREIIPRDSLGFWLKGYDNCMDEYISSVESNLTPVESAVSDLEKIHDGENGENLKVALGWILIPCIMLIVCVGYMIYLRKRYIVVTQARESQEQMNNRQTLIRELTDAANASASPYNPPGSLVDTKIYRRIKELINTERPIPADSGFWEEFEREVSDIFPDFFPRLMMLSGDSMTTRDRHLAMLIKCGVTSAQLCILLAKAKGTISHYRKCLGERLFGTMIPVSEMDRLIRRM